MCIVAKDNNRSVMQELRQAVGPKPIPRTTRSEIQRLVRAAGTDGVRNAVIHGELDDLMSSRMNVDRVLMRLEKAGEIVRVKQRIPDSAGRLRMQVVWYAPEYR